MIFFSSEKKWNTKRTVTIFMLMPFFLLIFHCHDFSSCLCEARRKWWKNLNKSDKKTQRNTWCEAFPTLFSFAFLLITLSFITLLSTRGILLLTGMIMRSIYLSCPWWWCEASPSFPKKLSSGIAAQEIQEMQSMRSMRSIPIGEINP